MSDAGRRPKPAHYPVTLNVPGRQEGMDYLHELRLKAKFDFWFSEF
jgi:hypothetical protein